MLKKYIFLVYLTVQLTAVYSQSMNNTLFFMDKTPQSNKLNPANQPDHDFWIGFPGLSSVYLNYNNNSFTINDLLTKKQLGPGERDSVIFTLDKFHSSLAESNYISVANELDIISMGLRVKRSYFTFGISQKSDLMFGYKKDLISFVVNGNTHYLGQTMDIGGLKLNGSVYNQISFGYSREFGPDKDFILGARINILMGVANVRTAQSDVTAYTDRDGMLVRIKAQQKMYSSLPLDVMRMTDEEGYANFDEIRLDDNLVNGRFYTGIDNLGWGLDVGMQYKPNEDLTIHASILDLGYIKWRSYLTEFKQGDPEDPDKPASFEWKGNDWGQPKDKDAPDFKDFEELMEDLADSLGYKFRFEKRYRAYNTTLNSKLYIGADYKINPNLKLGVLSRTQYYYGNIATSLTLSANASLSRNVGAYVSYTAASNNFMNLGLGLSAKLGCMQFYMVTDNVLASMVTSAQVANFRFGINFLFGHKNRERRKKYRLNEKEYVRNL